MIYDGEWRLSEYGTGEALLFNVKQDPGERQDLYGVPEHLPVRTRLQATLRQAIMNSIREANHDRRVYTSDFSQEVWFGREGWRRRYPRMLQDR